MAVPTRPATLVALLLAANAALAAADLAVTQTADRLTVQPGASGVDLVNFTVNLTNDGPDAADALVTSKLPAGLRIPAGTSAVASVGSYDPVTGVWDVGTLNSGQAATLLLPAQAIAGAAGCLVNVATAALAPGSGTTDPDPDNDSARVTVGAPACADLAVSSVRSVDAGVTCVDANQTFSVTNNGPNAATTVRLAITRYEVTSPAGFSEASCTTGNVVVPSPTTIDLGSLAPGETKQFVTGLRNLQRTGPDITVAYDVNATAATPDPDAVSNRESGSWVISRSGEFGTTDGTVCIVTNILRDSRFADGIPLLRRFRDRYLMTHPAGRAFVDWYYRVSPPALAYLARHDALREAAIMALVPMIYGLRYPAAAGGLALAALLVLGFRAKGPPRVAAAR